MYKENTGRWTLSVIDRPIILVVVRIFRILFILIVILADFDTTYDLNLIVHYHNYPYL
jgi:hypothetical protein